MKKVVISIICAILGCLLFVGTLLGVNFIRQKLALRDNVNKQEAETVTIVEPFVNEEPKESIVEIYDNSKGHVVRIYNYRFRVPGSIFEVPSSQAGSFTYISSTDNQIKDVIYYELLDVDDILTAIEEFFDGEPEGLLAYLPTQAQDVNLSYYMQDTSEGALATIYNDGTATYYTFVPMSKVCIVIESPEQLYFTNDAETAIFGDPSENPMTSHSYSMYEITAIENTRNALTDGAMVNTTVDLSSEVSSSSADYNSVEDNETRKQMLGFASFNWKEDGTADGTSIKMDTTSATAKASEWVLTSSSPYSFTDNAIKLHSLRATRNSESFTVEGKVTNQLNSVRPYVVVLKFLNNDSGLLGVGVVDRRAVPIEESNVGEWSYLLSSDTGIDLQEIYSVQFEIY